MDTTAGTAFSPDNDDWEQAEQTQRNEKFLRIGEVAEQLGVTLRTLRFYEDKKLVAPKRVGTTRICTSLTARTTGSRSFCLKKDHGSLLALRSSAVKSRAQSRSCVASSTRSENRFSASAASAAIAV